MKKRSITTMDTKPRIVTEELRAVVAENRGAIRHDHPNLRENSSKFKAAVVCLTAAHVGTNNLRLLSLATGVSYTVVCRYATNLRRSGIWTADGNSYASHLATNEQQGQLFFSFWLDVLIALGTLTPEGKAELLYSSANHHLFQ
jgi:hypothetical protein